MLFKLIRRYLREFFAGNSLIAYMVLPAQLRDFAWEKENIAYKLNLLEQMRSCHEIWVENLKLEEKISNSDLEKFSKYWLQTPFYARQLILPGKRNVALDTVEFIHADQISLPPQRRRYIICFNGNNSCYQQRPKEMLQVGSRLHCNVVGFNYRGVANSKGVVSSSKDLVEDGITQVNRLINEGVKSENIILKSESLGGAVAIPVARYFHEQGLPVGIFNARSFSSLTKVVSENVKKSVPVLLRWLAPLARWIIKKTWAMDIQKDWEELPETHKAIIHAEGDEIIPEEARLPAAGSPQKMARTFKLIQSGNTNGRKKDPHLVSLKKLHDDNGQTADDYFIKCCRNWFNNSAAIVSIEAQKETTNQRSSPQATIR